MVAISRSVVDRLARRRTARCRLTFRPAFSAGLPGDDSVDRRRPSRPVRGGRPGSRCSTWVQSAAASPASRLARRHADHADRHRVLARCPAQPPSCRPRPSLLGAPFDRLQARGVDLQHRQVVALLDADELGRERPAVLELADELALQLAGLGDDVAVRPTRSCPGRRPGRRRGCGRCSRSAWPPRR